MRILVCGSRDWPETGLLARMIGAVMDDAAGNHSHVTVIEGGARGADSVAAKYAGGERFDHECYRADWNEHGRAAGPIRNQRMLDEGKPDLVLAFTNDFDKSKGTRDMVERARKAGVPVKVYEVKVKEFNNE